MATVPAKHQKPLHNFSFPFPKWGQRVQLNTSDHCRRRYRNSSLTESSDSDLNNCNKPHRLRKRSSKHTARKIDEENSGVLLERGNNSGKLSDADVASVADGDVKPWNLRPRRFVISTGNGKGTVAGVSSVKSGWFSRGVSSAATAVEEEDNEDEQRKKKKRRLWISLSKEEIEDDVYAFTGSRPARRPKRRNRTIQKQVDNVFPGLYLIGISADSYRV